MLLLSLALTHSHTQRENAKRKRGCRVTSPSVFPPSCFLARVYFGHVPYPYCTGRGSLFACVSFVFFRVCVCVRERACVCMQRMGKFRRKIPPSVITYTSPNLGGELRGAERKHTQVNNFPPPRPSIDINRKGDLRKNKKQKKKTKKTVSSPLISHSVHNPNGR